MRILFLGSIGSGKSTQAKILSQDLRVGYVRSGDLTREKAKEPTSEGGICRNALHTGHLVPDEIIVPLVRERLAQDDCREGCIFDGYIRRLPQLRVFDPGYDLVIYLKIPEEIAENRLLARKREDDTLEIIRERLKVYHEETEPLVEYFREQNILVEIDATGSIEEITRLVKASVKERFNL